MSTLAITNLLNGTLQAISNVIPAPNTIGKPTLVSSLIDQAEMGVLIGITGDVKGRLILESETTTFSSISESMFGMKLDGDMLDSFTGELGNMIAGNMVTQLYDRQTKIDITPPTVIKGQAKLLGTGQALKVSVGLEAIGDLQVVLMVEQNQ